MSGVIHRSRIGGSITVQSLMTDEQVAEKVAEAIASDDMIAQAAAAAVDADPRITQLEADRVPAAEWTATKAAVARVAPDVDPIPGEQLRMTVSGPRSRTPGSVSPRDFMDDEPNGTTDNYAAIMQAYDRLGSRGGVIDLEGKMYRSNTPLVFNKATRITGGAGGHVNGGHSRGGEIQFPDGIDGIILMRPGISHVVIEDLSLTTNMPIGSRTAGSGNGLTINTQSAQVSNVYVRGFGGNGVHLDSTGGSSVSNNNMGQLNQVKVQYCGGHGIYFEGSDSNVWTVIGANVSSNQGYGIFNGALYMNTFIAPHAAFNVLGDYYDDAQSSMWLNPYSELGGKFVVGVNSRDGMMIAGRDGAPQIWEDSGTAITETHTLARQRGWQILRSGRWLSDIEHLAANGDRWMFRSGNPSATNFALYSSSYGGNVIRWTSAGTTFERTATFADGINMAVGTGTGTRIGTSATQKLGFFNKAPVVQPGANPDTSGATLAELEAEVNELKAALRALGLIAT